MFLWSWFWMRLTFNLVDWGKQIVFFCVGGPHPISLCTGTWAFPDSPVWQHLAWNFSSDSPGSMSFGLGVELNCQLSWVSSLLTAHLVTCWSPLLQEPIPYYKFLSLSMYIVWFFLLLWRNLIQWLYSFSFTNTLTGLSRSQYQCCGRTTLTCSQLADAPCPSWHWVGIVCPQDQPIQSSDKAGSWRRCGWGTNE